MGKNFIAFFLAVSVALVSFTGCSKEEIYRLIKVELMEGNINVARGSEIFDAFEGMSLVSADTVTVEAHPHSRCCSIRTSISQLTRTQSSRSPQ